MSSPGSFTWNHRIFERQLPQGNKWLFIGEASYDETGRIVAYTDWDDGDGLLGANSLQSLQKIYVQIGGAFDKPIVKLDKQDNVIQED